MNKANEGDELPLEGSSRTIGGIIRGRATGNFFNFADAEDIMEDRVQVQGLVKVYKSCVDIATDPKPTMVLKTEVTPSIIPVLKHLSRKYSPVGSKCHCCPIFLLSYINNVVELNQRIYVCEDGDWVIKGRYEDAIADEEKIEWSVVEGKHVISLCAVSLSFHTV